MTVSFQPWYTGQTYPAWEIPLATDAGNEDLTGVDVTKFSLTFRDQSGVDRLGTGTFWEKSLNTVVYKPSPGDVAQPFTGFLIPKALFPPSNSNLDEVVYDPIGGATAGSFFVITQS
jgi:hypothetical protein